MLTKIINSKNNKTVFMDLNSIEYFYTDPATLVTRILLKGGHSFEMDAGYINSFERSIRSTGLLEDLNKD